MGARTARAAILVLMLFLPVAGPLAGQSNGHTRVRWYLGLYGGTTSAGPAADVERGFVQQQFNETPDCGFYDCYSRSFPYSVTGWAQTGLPFAVELRFRVVGPADIELLAGRTPIGVTAGYHYPSELDMEYGVTFVAAAAGLWIPLPLPGTPRVHIAAGPAGYGAFWTPVRDQVELPTGHDHSVGLLTRTGFEVQVDNGIRVGFDFQYRAVGTATVGPVSMPAVVNHENLAAMRANYDHWAASVGFSIALQHSRPDNANDRK